MSQGYLVVWIVPEANGPGEPDLWVIIATFRDNQDAIDFAAMKNSNNDRPDTSYIWAQLAF